MSERDVETVRRRWSTTHDRGAHDYTDEGCRVLAEHAFLDVAFLLERERLLREALEFYANSSDNYMKAQAALAGMSFEEFRVFAATQEEGVR